MRIKTPPEEPQLLVFGWACWTLPKLTSSSSRTLSSTKMPCLLSGVSDLRPPKALGFAKPLGIFWFQIFSVASFRLAKKRTTFYLATFGVWLEDAGKLQRWIHRFRCTRGITLNLNRSLRFNGFKYITYDLRLSILYFLESAIVNDHWFYILLLLYDLGVNIKGPCVSRFYQTAKSPNGLSQLQMVATATAPHANLRPAPGQQQWNYIAMA